VVKAEALLETEPAEAARLAEDALKLAEAARHEIRRADARLALGKARGLLGHTGQARELCRQALEIYRRAGDRKGNANALMQLGNFAAESAEYDDAQALILKAKVIYTEIGDTEGVADCFNTEGYIEHSWSNFSRALECYLEGLHLLEEAGMHDRTASLLHNIGVVHAAQKNLDEAIKYLNKALRVSKQNNNLHKQAYQHVDIGSCYNRQGRYAMALEHHQLALEIRRQMGEKRQIADSLRALASTHTNLELYPSALKVANEALEIRRQIGDRWGVAETKLTIGSIHARLEHFDEARAIMQEAYEEALEIGVKVTVCKALKAMAGVAESCGDCKAALGYLKEHSAYREEIYSEEKHKHITELNLMYETEQKEQQLRQTQKLEAIGTLAGGIAHDFNNILNVILGYTELIQEKMTSAEDFSLEIDEVLVASRRARDLVHQILAFARKSEGRQAPVELVTLVKEVGKLSRSTLPAEVEISLEILTENAQVVADASQLHQVILNLITNARQALAQGGGTLKVRLQTVSLNNRQAALMGLREAGDYARLDVEDNGPGIPLEIQERIFDPFFTTKEPGVGTGLGLSAAHGIVTDLGGAIQVESAPGAGATFSTYLKLGGEFEAVILEEDDKPTRGTESILVVDDEPSIARVIGKTLDFCGYHTEIFTSPIEALEALRADAGRYDLVITDLSMPQMSGDALALEMHKLRPGLPVLLCTGFSESLTQDDLTALGISDMLFKPITRRELERAVRKALDGR